MRRREFIVLVGCAVAEPLVVQAEAPVPVVGFLRDGFRDSSQHLIKPFQKGLAEAGFVDGKNVLIDFALTEGRRQRTAELAADLVRRNVNVIVASAGVATIAAKAASATIPIVFATGNDPVALKLVPSIARPGGNITGISYLTSELGGKRLGLLHELVPAVTEFAAFVNPKNPSTQVFIGDVREAAAMIKARVHFFHITNAREIDDAFAALVERRLGALLMASDPFFTNHRDRIVALAARHALPAIYTFREFVADGGLMSYGAPLTEVYRQAGLYTGRVLKGEKPADLPVLQPTTFEMVVNLKAAKAQGIAVPPNLLARAEEVIE
jgi:putative ABC transport system substrate-binding protein